MGAIRTACVRDATSDDVVAMLVLWRALEDVQGALRMFPVVNDPEARIAAAFRRAIGDPDERAIVVETDGELVGMAILRVTEQTGGLSAARVVELSRVVVTPDRRGRGIGRELVRAAERFARERGAGYLVAKSFTGNESARRFWERAGFSSRYEERVRPILPAEDRK